MHSDLTPIAGSASIYAANATLDSAIEQSKRDVRHYAKRQMTWFRREEGVVWLDGFGDSDETAAKLWALIRGLGDE